MARRIEPGICRSTHPHAAQSAACRARIPRGPNGTRTQDRPDESPPRGTHTTNHTERHVITDITTIWNTTRGDWQRAGGSLASGNDIVTSVLISLFTDRVATPDDTVPDATRRLRDPRGWWADESIGSRLWLIDRAKRTQATLQRAQAYIVEALQWLVDDGVASRIEVTTEWTRQDTLGALVVVYSPRTGAPLVKIGTQNVFRLPDAQAWGWNAERGAGQWVELQPSLAAAPPLPGRNYQQEIAADAPLAWWKLDEPATAATATDSGTLGLPLAVDPTRATLGQAPLCAPGGSMRVLGVGENSAVAANRGALNFSAGNFTLTALVKTSATAIFHSGIVGVATTNVTYANWFLMLHSTGGLSLELFTGNMLANLTRFVSPVALNDGKVHRVAARRSGNVITLWQDGVTVLSGTFTSALWDSPAQVGVGCIPWSAGPDTNRGLVAGTVDEVAVWNRALSDERRVAQYAAIGTP